MLNPSLSAPVAILLGILAPLIVSALKGCGAPPWVNQGVTVVVCLGAGVLAFIVDNGGTGGISWALIFAWGGPVMGIASVVYHTYFYATPLNALLTDWLWGHAPSGGHLTIPAPAPDASSPGASAAGGSPTA